VCTMANVPRGGRGLPMPGIARGPPPTGAAPPPRGPPPTSAPPPRGPPPAGAMPLPGVRGPPAGAMPLPGAAGAHPSPMAMPGMGMGMGMPQMFAKPKGAEHDLKQKESSDIFHGAEHNDMSLVHQGLAGGGDVNVSNLQGVTPLILAVKNWPQNTQLITTLLKAGANPNAVSSDTSPIHEAVRKNSQQVLQLLLEHGAQVNLQITDGKTPLHLAIQQSQFEMVNYLLSKGADPRMKTQQNVTCLHFASSEGDKPTIEKFLSLGNNVNEQNANGKTALHIAAEKNHIDAIKVLLNAGADKKIRDAWGRLAEECGKVTAYKMLNAHKPGQKYEFVVVADDEVVLPAREDIS